MAIAMFLRLTRLLEKHHWPQKEWITESPCIPNVNIIHCPESEKFIAITGLYNKKSYFTATVSC